jgi:hypothetical protein
MPRIYAPDAATDVEEPPLQIKTYDQNSTLLKVAIPIASNASTHEITQAILDSGASCCVTPYLKDFLNQPIPIHNTTLKGIAWGFVDLGRGIHLRI